MGSGSIPRSLLSLFWTWAVEQPDKPLLRFYRDGAWIDWSYGIVAARVRALAGGLAALGVVSGDRVAIMSENRPEWGLADLAIQAAGGVSVSIYATLPAADVAYIMRHSGAKAVFAENAEQAAKLAVELLPELERIILLEGAAGGAQSMAEIEAMGTGDAPEVVFRPSDPIAILYTSGTTGVPKGVVLTHSNVIATLDAALGGEDTTPYDLVLSFLPLAHALERIGGLYLPIYLGRTIAYARGLTTLAEDFAAVRPAFFCTVPRVLEKVHARAMAAVAARPLPSRLLFSWALRVGGAVSRLQEAKRPVPMWLELQRRAADRLVFTKIRNRLGGRLKMLLCGGAPLSEEIARFFHSAGVTVCEGWGATETCAPATITRPHDFRFGSVGKPLPGVDVKLAADGELLVRGPNVFREYFKDAASTREAFDSEGFYRTGDIGRIDADGYYYVVDRKKDLIITSSGKNVAPQKLENMLRECPLIANALVHGDRRPYLVALVTIDSEVAGASGGDVIRVRVQSEIDRVNERLARYEQIKRFAILDRDFSTADGELTVTMKLRRRAVEAAYSADLDQLYAKARN